MTKNGSLAKMGVKNPMFGKTASNIHRKKIGDGVRKFWENNPNRRKEHGLKGERNGNWSGDNIGKIGVHDWIERERGKAKNLYCAKYDDGTCKGRLEWSNKSQKYKRELNDWWVLCGSHHRRYDQEINGENYKLNTGRFKKGMTPWNKK